MRCRQFCDDGSSFVLPPDTSLQAVIGYTPRRKRRTHGADGAASGDETPRGNDADDVHSVTSGTRTAVSSIDTATAFAGDPDDRDMALEHVSKTDGLLRISFANGTVQTFPLLAVTTTPYIELSPPLVHGVPTLAFGATHVLHPQEREIQLVNPTEAVAEWSIKHVPYRAPPPTSAAGARAKAAALAGETLPIDDPSAFDFSARSGVIEPRGGMVPTPFPLLVTFKPPAAGKYRCSFAMKVRAGMTVRLECQAEATLREEDIDVISTDKHIRLMQLGEIN